MIKLEPLSGPDKEPACSESVGPVIFDCGGARERTRGSPIGFSGERGFPPYNRYLPS